jgi:hypothetical protein
VDEVLYEQAERHVLYKKTRWLIVSELVIISVLILPLQIIHYFTYPKRSFLEYYILLIENVGYVSVTLMVVQFTNIVLLLRQRYKHLNKWFDIHSKLWREGTKSSVKIILLLEDMESCVCSSYNTKYVRRKALVQRQMYSKLHDTVHFVNSYFGVPVLMLIFWLFMCVVFISYSGVTTITAGNKEGKQLVKNMGALSGLIWCVICVLILFLIALVCHTTTEEYNKAKILVENLMLRSGLGYKAVNDLRVLSLQLNNMKVSFTAGGFFKLDLPFVHSFIGVVCTYIVILAQFQ